jgi:hypothetical protein
MRIVLGFLLPLFLILAGSCKKPILEIHEGTIPPLVLATSIHDSLPEKTIRDLKLEGITGIKIQYYSGVYSKYFEYVADKTVVLDAISELPFPMNANRSDTRCRPIPFQDLNFIQKTISPVELQSASDFWSPERSKEEVFECIKPPFRHIIITAPNSLLVRHRIELLAQS